MSRKEKIIENIIKQSLVDKNLNPLLTKINYNDQNKITIWKDLIERIQEQQGMKGIVDGTEHPYPVRKNDAAIDALLDLIIKYCNSEPADEDFSELYKKLKNDDEEVEFWNESVQEIVEEIKNIVVEDPTLIQVDENKEIKVSDIKAADAGNNYQYSRDNCVNPYINADGNTYDEIRGADKAKQLYPDNLRKLDYTNNHTDWITLLMPQYGRFVRIEDFNRNFWVISNAISGITNWLYEGSPTNKILKRLIDETTQIWENLLYLWLQVALMNQKKSEQIQILVEPVRSQPFEIMRKNGDIPIINCKVDNFKETFILSELPENHEKETFMHFAKEYSDSIVGILPIYRVNNYKENYYSGEWYDKFLIFDNNLTDENGDISYMEFKIVEAYGDNKTRPVVISPRYEINNRFSTKIYATRPEDLFYYYTYPFSSVNNKTNITESILFYGCLLVKKQISFSKQINGSIKFSELTLNVYDAAAPIGNIELGDYRPIGRFKLQNANTEYNENNNIIKLVYEEFIFQQQPMTTVEKRNCSEISKAYYLGEVASWRSRAMKS